MRSFSIIYLSLFFLFFILMGIGTILSISKIIPKKNVKYTQWLLGMIHFLIFGEFIILYIYPGNIRDEVNYSLYSLFNAIMLALFIIDIIMTFFLLLSLLFLQKRSKIFSFMGIIISSGVAPVLFYGTIFGVKDLVINRVDLQFKDLPRSFNNYKIVQISDVHLGNYLYSKELMIKTSELISEIDYDLLVFTGDMVNNFSYETKGFEDIFSNMTKDCLSFSILGNHDYGDYTDWESMDSRHNNFNGIVSSHKKMGFKLLRNEHSVIKKNDDSIFVSGVENWGHSPFPQYADLEKTLDSIPEASFIILLSHDPAHWESCIKEWNDIDLTLSGHTHGMQWGIKPAGIPFSIAWLSRQFWGGLYSYGNSLLYVNTGLGTIGFPWRIDMPAEITVFTLQCIEID